jgi:hypothetical protein
MDMYGPVEQREGIYMQTDVTLMETAKKELTAILNRLINAIDVYIITIL